MERGLACGEGIAAECASDPVAPLPPIVRDSGHHGVLAGSREV